jgi:hypothetical protein
MDQFEAFKVLHDCGYVVQCWDKDDFKRKYEVDLDDEEWLIVRDFCNESNTALDLSLLPDEEVGEIVREFVAELRETA